MLPEIPTLPALRAAHAAGATPLTVIEEVIVRRAALARADAAVFISQVPDADLRDLARALAGQDPGRLPLYGVPFVVKDNIAAAELPTTAACPAFAYQPKADAAVVARLKAAGAICWARPTSTSSPPG